MPTKRTRRTHQRTTLTLRSFHGNELFDFADGWSPPRYEHDLHTRRWKTWQEFLSDYEAVRDEFLRERPFCKSGVIPFAEWARSKIKTNPELFSNDSNDEINVYYPEPEKYPSMVSVLTLKVYEKDCEK